MNKNKMTQKEELFTRIILETFRFNGALIAKGDILVKDLGLTSATWQVLGAIDAGPMTMAQIARDKGVTRQSVRRNVRLLEVKGFVRFKENPDHMRAKLVELTKQGRSVLDKVTAIHSQWAAEVSENIEMEKLETTLKTIKNIIMKIDQQQRSR